MEVGLLEEEAKRLNEAFFKHITTGMPFVILKLAMSLDGKIATAAGESRWISCEESRLMVHRLRDQVDAVMVGIGTILKDDPSLTTRLPDGGRDPIRVVVDSLARTPPSSKVINPESPAPTLIAVTPRAPRERMEALKRAGAEVLVIDEDEGGRVDLVKLMKELGGRDIQSVMVEGGSELAWSLIEADLVDKLLLFIAPKIIGGKEAPTAIGGKGIAELAKAKRVYGLEVRRVGEDVLITGYLRRSAP